MTEEAAPIMVLSQSAANLFDGCFCHGNSTGRDSGWRWDGMGVLCRLRWIPVWIEVRSGSFEVVIGS